MRYRAFPYITGVERGGQPSADTLSDTPVRCHLRPVRGQEVDDEAGIHSIVAYELIFWLRDAEVAGIESGSRLRVDNADYHVDFALPSGIGLRQKLVCTATRL